MRTAMQRLAAEPLKSQVRKPVQRIISVDMFLTGRQRLQGERLAARLWHHRRWRRPGAGVNDTLKTLRGESVALLN